MKKQILISIVLFFAGISFALAQDLTDAPECPTPTPVNTTCIAADALHPIPGTAYDYEVDVPTPAGTKYYNWFVTQDENFITTTAGVTSLTTAIEANTGAGVHIQATGTGYNDPGTPPTPGTGTNSINITWKSFIHSATDPVYLVIYVLNDDGCTTDNIQVYVIEPRHAFTLDIANNAIDGSAQTDLYGTCVAPVASAIYDIPSQTVIMDYGINYIFFTVIAANFTDSWLPSFEVGGAGLSGTRVVTAVDWAYPTATGNGVWTSATGGPTDWTSPDPVEVQNVTGGNNTVGQAGECIVVRVTIDNNKAETITDAVISLAVDGIMLDPATGLYATATLGDIHDADCTIDGFDNDVISQTLTSRPQIDAVDPTPFEDQDHD